MPPPDFYNDFQRQGFGFWQNPEPGWVVGSDGQAVEDVQFVSDGAQPKAFIRKDTQISFVMAAVDTSVSTPDTLRRLDMSFTGELFLQPDAVAIEEQPGHRNFYFPHCADGITDVHAFNRVLYKNIYAGIDLWLYCGQRGQKMALVVHPGADPDDIRLVFDGQNTMDLDILGNLRLLLDEKWIVLPEAVAYQYEPDNTILPLNWTAEYVPNNNTGQVGFTFDAYDTAKPLVLLIGAPPMMGGNYDELGLCWSTYIGGDGEDYIVQTAQDNAQNFYAAGSTSSPIATFPVTTGVENYDGGTVAFVLKFKPDEQLEYKSFFGGEDPKYCRVTGCTLTQSSGSNGVYIAGRTNSSQLPVSAPNGQHMMDIGLLKTTFIAKFNLTSGELTWASYFEAYHIGGIASSTDGRVYLTGRSHFASWPVNEAYLDVPPPTAESEYWPSSTGEGNVPSGFVAMLNQEDKLNWFTFVTNNATVISPGVFLAYAWPNSEIAVRGDRVVMLAECSCPTLPSGACPPGAYCDPAYYDGDIKLYEFNLNGELVWDTYIHSVDPIWSLYADGDPGSLVAIDPVTGDVVITSKILGYGGGFEIVPGTGWYSNSATPAANILFAMRFSGLTRDLIWSSFLPMNINPGEVRCVAFDDEGALYIAGQCKGLGVPLNQYGGYYHQPTINPNEGVEQDAFLICIGPDFSLRFATYIGGEAAANAGDQIYDILQRNTNGHIYVAGYTGKGTDQTTYFPLDDGGGIPDFWDEWAGATTDAMIASFCPEAPTMLPSSTPDRSGPHLLWPDDNHIALTGLGDGLHPVSIYDASGRLVHSALTSFSHGRSSSLGISELHFGAYLVVCQGVTYRFIKR